MQEGKISVVMKMKKKKKHKIGIIGGLWKPVECEGPTEKPVVT